MQTICSHTVQQSEQVLWNWIQMTNYPWSSLIRISPFQSILWNIFFLLSHSLTYEMLPTGPWIDRQKCFSHRRANQTTDFSTCESVPTTRPWIASYWEDKMSMMGVIYTFECLVVSGPAPYRTMYMINMICYLDCTVPDTIKCALTRNISIHTSCWRLSDFPLFHVCGYMEVNQWPTTRPHSFSG